MLTDYVGIGRRQREVSITDVDTLSRFLGSRASHVAQASLYGYLRTRAGTRFPTLFENPDLLKSINFAKWHIWLACVSDLGLTRKFSAQPPPSSPKKFLILSTLKHDHSLFLVLN